MLDSHADRLSRCCRGHTEQMSDQDLEMYGRLASCYGLLMSSPDFVADADEVLRLLEDHTSAPLETALELGSGGGHLASHLVGRLQMTLTDLSPEMLAVNRKLNPDAEHIEGDMRTLRLGRSFDAVIIRDAISYMTTEADLRAAIETAWAHLRPGGVAIFLPDWVRDSYVPHSEHGGSDEGDRGLRYLEWDRRIEPDGHTVKADYVIVTRDGDEVAIHHEVHKLGIFPRATWLDLLDAIGFESHRVVGAGLDIFIGVRRR
jgi:SAM-dependent methyltransferase